VLASALTLILLIVQFGLYRVYDKFATDPMQGARPVFARNTIEAAKAYMPFGSGVGTFVSVYPTFERPQDTIANVYANHAHDDWLEIWLEGGIVSIVLAAGFLIWFSLRSKKLWQRSPGNILDIDVLLARASTVAVPLILIHSVVDYPLRTDAMMAVFAFCCAFLVVPPKTAREEDAPRSVAAKVDVAGLTPAARPAPPVPAAPRRTARPSRYASPKAEVPRWGQGIEWPEEWRKGKS
jgi:hypothetical protein